MNKSPTLEELKRGYPFPWKDYPAANQPIMKHIFETYTKDYVPADVNEDFLAGTQWMIGCIIAIAERGVPVDKSMVMDAGLSVKYFWDFVYNAFSQPDEFDTRIKDENEVEMDKIIDEFMRRVRERERRQRLDDEKI